MRQSNWNPAASFELVAGVGCSLVSFFRAGGDVVRFVDDDQSVGGQVLEDGAGSEELRPEVGARGGRAAAEVCEVEGQDFGVGAEFDLVVLTGRAVDSA